MSGFSIGSIYTAGWGLILNPHVLIMLVVGTLGGILIGAMPGLTATMGVAVMTPLTYGMDIYSSFALLLGVYCGGIYGGSITAIVAKIPGTPSSIMTALDGYPMAQKGQAGKAIGIATLSSFIGGLFSVVILSIAAPAIASMALDFSGQEYFAIGVFGLTVIAYISGDSMAKGFFAGFLGLLIATIGSDPISGYERFTFGSFDLLSGVQTVPVMIGLFGLSEVLNIMEKHFGQRAEINKNIGRILPERKEFRRLLPSIFRSSAIGTFIGAVPAAGGTIAAICSYGVAKSVSRHPEEFGKGSEEGLASCESANNASTGGAMIPMLTLGVPGDAITSILIGALMMKGLNPGPLLFQNNMPVVSAIFLLMALANLVFTLFGLTSARYIAKVINAPMQVMTAVIVAFCMIGSYALRNSTFDIFVMLIAGIVGYLLSKAKIPTAPLILGLVLGDIVESGFRRGLVLSKGNYSTFITRPICAVFLGLAVLMLLLPRITKAVKKHKESKSAA